MPDTTTPSAAEVMGWHSPPERLSDATKLCASCGTPFDPPMTKRSPCCGDCWYDLSEWYAYAPEPTPDDMLAWLREQSYDVDVTGRRTHLAGDYLAGRGHVTVTLTAFRCDPESYTAPTLHAALEQAVIAVGRAE